MKAVFNQRRLLAGFLAVAVLASAFACCSLSVFADESTPTKVQDEGAPDGLYAEYYAYPATVKMSAISKMYLQGKHGSNLLADSTVETANGNAPTTWTAQNVANMTDGSIYETEDGTSATISMTYDTENTVQGYIRFTLENTYAFDSLYMAFHPDTQLNVGEYEVYVGSAADTLFDEANRVLHFVNTNGEAAGEQPSYAMNSIYENDSRTLRRSQAQEYTFTGNDKPQGNLIGIKILKANNDQTDTDKLYTYDFGAFGTEVETDDSQEPSETPVNLLTEHMESIKSVQQDKETDAVTDSTKFNGALEPLTDGEVPTSNMDINSSLWAVTGIEEPKAGTANEGVQITLDKAYTLSKIQLHQGISAHPDYVRVYASEKLADLYKESSLIADDEKATGLVELETTTKAKYIAILVTKTTTYGIARVKEYMVMGLESTGTDVEEGSGGNAGSGSGSGSDTGSDSGSTSINLIEQIDSVQGIVQFIETGVVSQQSNPFGETQAAAMHDGNTATHVDVGNSTVWKDMPRYAGVLMTLKAPVEAEKAVLYSGLSDHVDVLKVYAASNLTALYSDDNLIAEDLECNGEAKTVTIGKNIQYMAVIFTGTVNETDNWRPKEFEIWGKVAEQPAEPPVNLLENHLLSIKGVSQDKETGAVADTTKFNNMLPALTDGKITKEDATEEGENVQKDVGIAEDKNEGVQITLDKAYTLSKLQLYEGTSGAADYVRVYASEKLEDLYKDSSMLIDNKKAAGLVELEPETPVKARHIAVLVTETTAYNLARYFEYLIWGLESTGTEVDEKLNTGSGSGSGAGSGAVSGINLIDHITEVVGLLEDVKTKAVSGGDRFSQAACDAIHDGVTNKHEDVYGALDWEYPKNVGVRLGLHTPIEVENLVLYSGISSHMDTLKVYAAENAADLYKESSLVKENVECKGEAVVLPIGKKIQYVAIFVTAYNGSWRPKEFELYAAEGTELPEIVKAENLLPDQMESVQCIQQDVQTGAVHIDSSERFDMNGALDAIFDGNVSTHVDVYGGLDFEQPKNIGVLVTLKDTCDVGNIKVHAGLSTHVDYWRVYASDTLDDLYTRANQLGNSMACAGTASVVSAAKKVKYVAFLLTGYDGNGRVCEFEIFSATGYETPTPPPTGDDVIPGGGSGGSGGSGDAGGSGGSGADTGSLLFGLSPDNAGVTTGTDFEQLGSTGGNLGFEGLTDGIITDPTTGKKQDAQFWNGKPAGTKFVFTYDLGMNYDLTSMKVYSVENYLEGTVNQGIETWTFYASRYREDLFNNENKIVGKTGYSDPADIGKDLSMKQIRFVSLVVTIQDTVYGACRMTEFEVYGTESAEQDSSKPSDGLAEYVDKTTADGVIVRIYALDETEDVSELDVKVSVEKTTAADQLQSVSAMLDSRYYAEALFALKITDSTGEEMDLGDRQVRLLIPVKSAQYMAAVVDIGGADLLSAKYVDGSLMFDAINDSVYATVIASGEDYVPGADDSDTPGTPDAPGASDESPDGSTSPTTGEHQTISLIVLLVALLSAAIVLASKKKELTH